MNILHCFSVNYANWGANLLSCDFLDGVAAGGIGYGPGSYSFGQSIVPSLRPWNSASSEGSLGTCSS